MAAAKTFMTINWVALFNQAATLHLTEDRAKKSAGGKETYDWLCRDTGITDLLEKLLSKKQLGSAECIHRRITEVLHSQARADMASEKKLTKLMEAADKAFGVLMGAGKANHKGDYRKKTIKPRVVSYTKALLDLNQLASKDVNKKQRRDAIGAFAVYIGTVAMFEVMLEHLVVFAGSGSPGWD